MSGSKVLVIDDSPTILKVVQLVLSKAGFQVEVAENGEAGIQKAKALDPDLILLDFVMPRMNGYQVCRALSADESLAEIPVVLMSAKGDQVGERFVKVMGIVDYITKPFSPEAITAVVQHTIAKHGSEDLTQDTNLPDSEISASQGITIAKQSQQLREGAIAHLRSLIVSSMTPGLTSLMSLVESTRNDSGEIIVEEDAIAKVATSVLEDSVLLDLFRNAHPIYEEAELGPSLHGDVRIIPIAEILQLLDAQRQTGILQVNRGESTLELYFREGRVDLALARSLSEDYLLGRYIIEGDLITPEDLSGFLESRRPSSQLLGTQLVKLGYLSKQELQSVLTKQSRELVYELLRWNFGTFQFVRTNQLPPAALDAMLSLEIEGILMEGFRRVDEWHLIEREVNNFDLVFLRNEDKVSQMGRGKLTRDELSVLELVNGKHTVKELIRESKIGSYEVSKILYRLHSIKLVRKRVKPVAV